MTSANKLQVQWRFPPNCDGAEYGFENAAAAHFQSEPIVHLIRELVQNSLDAKMDGLNEPVHVALKGTEISTRAIGGASLRPHIEACMNLAAEQGHAAAQNTYAKALRLLESPVIPCLSVVDSGATGLAGDSWNALVTQEGRVHKNRAAAGGSYGIGKNAVFNVTDLQSVIYSTRFLARRRGREEKMQGKSRLLTHALANDENTPLQHIGFYRMADNSPLRGKDIPEEFRLAETGAGIFIPGFNPHCVNWAEAAARAVIENYFFAIHNQRLTVTIQSEPESPVITLNHETIDQHFALADKSPAYAYYRAIRDCAPEAVAVNHPLDSLELYFLKGEGPRRTACLNRSGMLITDSRERKNNQLAPPNRSYWPDYTAVVIPATDNGDAWLRQMENPGHDSYSPAQISDPNRRQQAEFALSEVRNTLSATYEENFNIAQYPETSNLSELAYALPDPHSEIPEERELSTLEIRHTPSSVARKPQASFLDDRQAHTFKNLRIIRVGAKEAIIAFTPSHTGPAQVKLYPTGGERRNETPLKILSAEDLDRPDQEIRIARDIINLQTKAGERVRLQVTTEQSIVRLAFTLQPD